MIGYETPLNRAASAFTKHFRKQKKKKVEKKSLIYTTINDGRQQVFAFVDRPV